MILEEIREQLRNKDIGFTVGTLEDNKYSAAYIYWPLITVSKHGIFSDLAKSVIRNAASRKFEANSSEQALNNMVEGALKDFPGLQRFIDEFEKLKEEMNLKD